MDKKVVRRTITEMTRMERVGSGVLFISMVIMMTTIVVGAATDGQPTVITLIEGVAFGAFIIIGLIMLVKG